MNFGGCPVEAYRSPGNTTFFDLFGNSVECPEHGGGSFADGSKVSKTLGSHPLPVEVVRFGLRATMRLIEALSAEAGCEGEIRLRPGKGDLPFITDQGNLIVDCAFNNISEPEVLAFALKRVPGVVEHGLFLGLADLAFVATSGGVKTMRRAGE